MSSIATLLADPNCRLLTLVGSGGIGKTRIACESAAQIANGFLHGSYFVPLAPISSPDLVALTLASTIGLFLEGTESPRNQVINYLSGRELLLVLDNFEHLLSAVDLIIEILEAAPAVRILVTSRERLNIREEWVLDIYGLNYPQDEIIHIVEQYSAIHFFLKCACRVKADFRLTETVQPSVIRICRLVEGVPLGIELAASWVRTFSCQTIADEIERNLDFLVSSQRNMPQKHGSMRAVFDQSYNLLTEEQQQVFRKLSVFRGGFQREAAGAIASASVMTLAALVDKSLLRVSAEGRYDMHELLRQYGENQLRATDIVDSVHDVHSSTYADFIHQRVDDLKGRRQLEALAEINADFENLRTAWNWASDHNNGDRINKMLDGLTLFCELRSRSQEVGALLRYAKTQFAGDHRFERVWGRLISHTPDEIEHLQDELQTALQIARHYDDLAEVAVCLRKFGSNAHEKHDFTEAKQLFEQSLMYYRQLGDRYEMASVLFDLMSISYQGNWRTFKMFGEESLQLRREIGDRIGAAWSLAPLAVGEGQVGHFVEAERLWFERITLGNETGTRQLTATTYGHLSSQVYFVQGDFDKTRAAAEEALKIASTLNHSNATGLALITLGLVASIEERYEDGKNLCEKGAATKIQPYVREMAAWGLSLAACGLGDYAAAGEFLSAALKYLFNLRGSTGIIASLPIAAILLAHRGNAKHAVELLALAFTHPVHASGWIEKWPLLGRLRSKLEQELGYEAYAEAWERGTLLDLDAVAAELVQQFQRNPILSKGKETLSERELEVLRLIAEGCSNQDIANRLYIGVSTVKKHINHIYDKLDAKNRTQAVAVARQRQLLTR